MQAKKKILIVDEDSNYITGLRKELTQAGFEVIYWDDGKKALDLSNNIRPDLIIAEVNLPNSDGHLFFKEVKANQELKDVPFIFLSNQKRVDDRIKSMELGVDDFIVKPFYIEEIVARIENLFNEIRHYQTSLSKDGKGFSGNLAEMNLIDLIQTLDVGKKSARIRLNMNSLKGIVYINNGEVVDATLGDLSPEESLYKLFLWTEGRYQVELTNEDYPQTLNEPTAKLISEGMKRNSRWEQIKKNLPPLNTIIAVNKIAYQENNITGDEKALLKTIDKNNKIFEIVHNSPLDDIKSLELIDNLLRKGYLQETNDNFLTSSNNQVDQIKKNLSKKQTNSHDVSYIISNLLKKKNEQKIVQVERRRDDRRQKPDRRRYDRRQNDRNPDYQIYLDRTELLLIREKLL